MTKTQKVLGTVVVFAVLAAIVCFTISALTPSGRKFLNKWEYGLKKADEQSYESQKQVEDTLRAYLASYEVDKTTYLAYKDSTDKYESALAKSAKARLIETATYYNEYFSKNSFIWKGNKPSDLPDKLEIDF